MQIAEPLDDRRLYRDLLMKGGSLAHQSPMTSASSSTALGWFRKPLPRNVSAKFVVHDMEDDMILLAKSLYFATWK
jgi:hypothetical protein